MVMTGGWFIMVYGIVLPTFECVFLTPINAMMAIFFDGNITGNQCNLTVAKMTDVLLRLMQVSETERNFKVPPKDRIHLVNYAPT